MINNRRTMKMTRKTEYMCSCFYIEFKLIIYSFRVFHYLLLIFIISIIPICQIQLQTFI